MVLSKEQACHRASWQSSLRRLVGGFLHSPDACRLARRRLLWPCCRLFRKLGLRQQLAHRCEVLCHCCVSPGRACVTWKRNIKHRQLGGVCFSLAVLVSSLPQPRKANAIASASGPISFQPQLCSCPTPTTSRDMQYTHLSRHWGRRSTLDGPLWVSPPAGTAGWPSGPQRGWPPEVQWGRRQPAGQVYMRSAEGREKW